VPPPRHPSTDLTILVAISDKPTKTNSDIDEARVPSKRHYEHNLTKKTSSYVYSQQPCRSYTPESQLFIFNSTQKGDTPKHPYSIQATNPESRPQTSAKSPSANTSTAKLQ
jgi:hypothetical protein